MYPYLDKFLQEYKDLSGDGEGQKKPSPFGLTLGVVVNTDDPLQQGRLQVFCPALNDSPKKIHHLPWCAYVTPFGGVVNNNSFTRGVSSGPEVSNGAIHYGFWAIPEQGAKVLVGCVDGDFKRRFWIGCIPEHQETHTMMHGRYNWGGAGLPDGPFTSAKSPIEPLYTNFTKAFVNRQSREWKTRGADYQATAVDKDVGQTPNSKKSTYLDQQYGDIAAAEQDDWVKPILGAHGYDWTGYKNLGAFLSSRVYGMTTPGFHSLSMDDRPFNSRIRMRSATGHQIIFDDTNERIYLMTNEGNSWVEMDTSGNVDIYTKRRLSVRSEKDINFSTDETFRVHAKKGIHLYSGNNIFQENLESVPNDGEIRIHAENDLHLISNENIRHYSRLDTLVEIGGKKCESIGDTLFLHVQNDINTITNTGNYNLTISGNINEIVQGDVKRFALGKQQMSSNGNAEVFSFRGKMDIGSQQTMNIKSVSQDITMEAVGANSGSTGGVFIKAPESQYGVSNEGISWASNKKVKGKSEKPMELEIGKPTIQDRPLPPQNIGDCNIGDSVPVTGTGAELAARAAYNAGFRGDALVMAVAIAKGESSYNPNALGDVGIQTDKWGPSHGLWQIRTLKNPQNYGFPDTLRVADGRLYDPQTNAEAAFAISKGGTDFTPWSVYTAGIYRNFLDEARAAVAALCNSESPEAAFNMLFGSSHCPGADIGSLIKDYLPIPDLSTSTLLKLTEEGINMQSPSDITFKSLSSLLNPLSKARSLMNMASALDSTIFNVGTLALSLGPVFSFASVAFTLDIGGLSAALGALTGPIGNLASAVSFLQGLDFDISIDDVPSFDIPLFDGLPQSIFYYSNHDLTKC